MSTRFENVAIRSSLRDQVGIRLLNHRYAPIVNELRVRREGFASTKRSKNSDLPWVARSRQLLRAVRTNSEEIPAQVAHSNWRYTFLEIKRATEISAAALEFLAFLACQNVASALLGKDYDKDEAALLLERILSRLGPTFVKLAQTASMRPDLVGDSYSRALAKLQDSVDPFDNEIAYRILENEIGQTVPEVFETFSSSPIASASMGQVYRGVLLQEFGGKEVAVKVRRPGVYDSIQIDLSLLRKTIGAIQKAAGIKRDLRILVDEVGAGLLGECDFRNEVKNSREFLRAHRQLPFITIPLPVEQFCSERVFISEWIDGKSPNQMMNESGDADHDAEVLNLVKMGIQCSLSQLLVTGCMHGGMVCVTEFKTS